MPNLPPSDNATCMDEYDPNALSVEQAHQRILDATQKMDATASANVEYLPTLKSFNRVLAQDIRSGIEVPAYTNSAMDGYAMNGEDLKQQDKLRLRVVATVFAGAPVDQHIQRGECARIMTGAPMPAGTDSVVMQEYVTRHEDFIEIEAGQTPQQNVRQAGEDIQRGQIVLKAGTRIGAAEMGLIASVGVAEVCVYRRVRVAFFSTGDELAPLGGPLKAGQIYDSNRYTLTGQLAKFDADIIDMGVIADQPDAVEKALSEASQNAEILITTGGVSVGDADYVKAALEHLGQVNFWKISMKPGRPLAFGHIGECLFFGLPGNPVSSMVTFMQFVLPALRKRAGENNRNPLLFTAICTDDLRKRSGRMEFQRAILSWDEEKGLLASSTGKQDSHLLTSMSRSNAFILLPSESTGVKAGDQVTVQLFSDLL